MIPATDIRRRAIKLIEQLSEETSGSSHGVSKAKEYRLAEIESSICVAVSVIPCRLNLSEYLLH